MRKLDYEADALQKVVHYLEIYYPTLPKSCFNGNQIAFLDARRYEGSGRKVWQVTDHQQQNVVWASGAECFGYLNPQWHFTQTYRNRIQPEGYNKFHPRFASTFYDLYFRHRLARFGLNLVIIQQLVLADAHGILYQTVKESRVLVTNQESWPILTVSSLTPIGEWTINDHPVPVKPSLFLLDTTSDREEEMINNLTSDLIKMTTEGLLHELGLTNRQILVCRGHALNLPRKEIARSLNLPVSTVNYDNTEILNMFRQKFSNTFQTAEECVHWLLRNEINP